MARQRRKPQAAKRSKPVEQKKLSGFSLIKKIMGDIRAYFGGEPKAHKPVDVKQEHVDYSKLDPEEYMFGKVDLDEATIAETEPDPDRTVIDPRSGESVSVGKFLGIDQETVQSPDVTDLSTDQESIQSPGVADLSTDQVDSHPVEAVSTGAIPDPQVTSVNTGAVSDPVAVDARGDDIGGGEVEQPETPHIPLNRSLSMAMGEAPEPDYEKTEQDDVEVSVAGVEGNEPVDPAAMAKIRVAEVDGSGELRDLETGKVVDPEMAKPSAQPVQKASDSSMSPSPLSADRNAPVTQKDISGKSQLVQHEQSSGVESVLLTLKEIEMRMNERFQTLEEKLQHGNELG